jgi:hypothetical protein
VPPGVLSIADEVIEELFAQGLLWVNGVNNAF